MTVLMFANIILVLGALSGMYCIAHQDRRGFIIFLGVEAAMSYIGITTNNYGLVVAAILYFVMNVYSYIQWTKAEKPRRAAKKAIGDAAVELAIQKTLARYKQELENLKDKK